MKILGLVENMSGLDCPHCGKSIELFKTNGGMLTAKKESLRFLGRLPLDPEVVMQGDAGGLAVLDNDAIAFSREFNKLVDEIVNVHDREEGLH